MAAAKKRTSARTPSEGTKRAKTKAAKKAPTSAPRKRGRPKTKGRRPPTEAAKKAAQKAAQQAEAAEAVGGKGLTAAQRQLRDTAIVARRAAGWTQQMCSDEFAITVKQVSRVEAARGRLPSGLDARPMQILEDLLRSFDQTVGDGEAMAHAYAEKHPSAAVGAKRLASEARTQKIHLLMALGKLPQNLELYRSEAQMVRIAEEMVGKLEELMRGEAEVSDVLAFFRDLLPEDAQVPQLAA